MLYIVLWIPAYAGMTVRDMGMTVRDAGDDGRPVLPLWIADQVRNDVGVVPSVYGLYEFG